MLETSFPSIHRKSTALGFGCMRLPVLPDGKIDEAEAIRMIRHAIDSGVRYVDTAYPYHGGQSEVVLGKALKDGYREKVILTSKLPCWAVNTHEDMMRLLNEQLERLQEDHLDFYILHALDLNRYHKMKELNYPAFYDQALKSGKIRYTGFSFHDEKDAFVEILNDYPWQMCQVQMNILDENNQATIDGIRLAGEKGIGVVIMEPLRGGLLAAPPKEVQERYQAFHEQRTPVEWAFRYLYTMPEVITILSGMSSMEQVEDNLRIFNAATRTELSQAEKDLYSEIRAIYLNRMKTRCTGCEYCQPCPKGVAIPKIFQGYDRSLLREGGSFVEGYQKLIQNESDASRCVKCRKCEKACPQHLPITQFLQEIHAICTV